MNGYIKASVCHNLSGFIRYCRNGSQTKSKDDRNKNRDDFIEEYSTVSDMKFWSNLAKENRNRHKESKHITNRFKKAVEARQLMIKEKYGSEHTAQQIAEKLKEQTGTEWIVFKHRKDKNVHFHCIGADRKLLDNPIPEKRAVRTYYYDANGKKCKKADAVKVVPKGTVLQSAQMFSEKVDELRTRAWLSNLKDTMYKFLEMQKFDCNEEFAYFTVGTYNIKSNQKEKIEKIKAGNSIKAEINAYFRKLKAFEKSKEIQSKIPAKQYFCEHYNIRNRMYGDNAEKMAKAFEQFKIAFPLPSESQNKEDLTVKEENTCIESSEALKSDFETFDEQSVAPEEKTAEYNLNELSEDELREKYMQAKTELYEAEQKNNDASLIQQLKEFIEEIINILKELFGYNDTGIAMLDEKVEEELGLDNYDY